ncbi:MAG: hypothetical protein GYB58_04935 [Gammaproteobacteria bacterium]|nr:hypothetical protein [Gammaproteobacteria bacterium]
MKGLRKQFADTMLHIGQQDESLVVMVGDISHGILQPFAKACPGRFFNIGILEPSMVSMAAGFAKQGLVPVTHTIAPFLIERSFEQLKLDFGYQALAGNFISVGGAFDYAQLGCSHHCYTDVSLLAHLPGSQVFCPGSAVELDVLFSAEYRTNAINYFRLTENPHGVEFAPESIRPGKIICAREGHDITIIALGPQLKNALSAATSLSARGIEAEVLYVHTFKPFDSGTVVDSLMKTRRIVVVEELSAQDGLYNAVLRSWDGRGRMLSRQLAINEFIHGYGSYEDLCERSGLSAGHIAQAAAELVSHEVD